MSEKPEKLRVWLPAIRAYSGADIFTERLAEALRRAGHEPLVHWFNQRYELVPELMRLCRRPENIDVIHANSWNAHVFLGQPVPVVTTVLHLVHDPAYAPYRSTMQAIYHRGHVRWREARAVRECTAVTAISDYVGRTVREVFAAQSVQVIPNWVDTGRYSPSAAYCLPEDRRFRLLMVGNHSRRKGNDLLPAFARALGAKFDLRITGGLRGHDGSATSANVSSLGRLSEQELIEEYRHCDAVVSLSRYEGFGYTALEGMACGKPFLGFRTSGLTDVVAEESTGFLVAIDDLEALVERCRKLLRETPLLERMGRSGRTRALTEFSENIAINSYVKIYRRAALNA